MNIHIVEVEIRGEYLVRAGLVDEITMGLRAAEPAGGAWTDARVLRTFLHGKDSIERATYPWEHGQRHKIILLEIIAPNALDQNAILTAINREVGINVPAMHYDTRHVLRVACFNQDR